VNEFALKVQCRPAQCEFALRTTPWVATQPRQAKERPGHADFLFSLAFSPDGKTLVSGSGD